MTQQKFNAYGGWGEGSDFAVTLWYGGGYKDYWSGNDYWINSFLSNGIRWESDGGGAGVVQAWLAIKFDSIGRRKAHLMRGNEDYDNRTMKPNATGVYSIIGAPYADYHILPENVIVGSDFGRNAWQGSYPPWKYYATSSGAGVGLSFWGGGTRVLMSTMNGRDRWDKHTQFDDQVAASLVERTDNWGLSQRNQDTKEWATWLSGNFMPVRDGIVLDVDYYDVDNDPYTGWVSEFYGDLDPHILIIGLAEYVSSMPAFCHGERADWPSRTPRGCYLEGSIALQTSSTPAFMQVGPHGKVPVYLDGFVEGKSVKAAYLAGLDTDLDNIPVFVPSQVLILTNSDAYTVGQDTFSGNQESFIWGKGLDLDDKSAFLVGGLLGSSSISAWCRSGTDVDDFKTAFLEGDDSRSKTLAYTNGFSATPTGSTPAFLGGGGPWPFTDDYTGADEDPWNAAKWISTEEV